MFKELIQTDASQLEQLRNASILIADERGDESGSLYQMLEEAGYLRLQACTDRDEILSRIRQGYRHDVKQIHLLVMSTTLDSFDVLDFAQTLNRHDGGNTPVIFIGQNAGWFDEQQLLTAYQAGAVDMLNRPLRIAEVIPRINLALLYRQEKQHRLQQEEDLNTKLSERRIMEARLEHLLNHDDLTALPSRHRLEAALKISLSKSKNLNRTSALIFIDIDHFRIVNDTLGHTSGDALLKRTADLLKVETPDEAMPARIGSDEFAILLDDIEQTAAFAMAEKIEHKLSHMVCCKTNDQMNINASFGVVMIEPGTDITSASEVLARGELACNIAKHMHPARISLFDHQSVQIKSLQQIRRNVTLVRKALSNDWFRLHLQPIVDLAKQKTSHYEVLVRLIDRNGDMHSPAEFVPAAEKTGLIHKLDFWVIDHALDLLAQLTRNQVHVSLSINMSSDGLQSSSILELIKNKISYLSLPASQLMFELTETAAVKNEQLTRENISKLRALGCRFAIDDFGTGFSSFSYIKNYPADFIKIDGSFIQNLVNEPADQILVRSMVEISHNLGKKVIAEYVENQATQQLLLSYGVDYVQGYHIGKPAPAEKLLGNLAN